MPARSNAPSPSSHFLGFGNRKPGGGGPAGVAARARVVEKKATVAGEGRRPDANCGDRSSVAAGRLRANMVNGFALAIVSVMRSRASRVLLSIAEVVVKLGNSRLSLVTPKLRLAKSHNDGNNGRKATFGLRYLHRSLFGFRLGADIASQADSYYYYYYCCCFAVSGRCCSFARAKRSVTAD